MRNSQQKMLEGNYHVLTLSLDLCPVETVWRLSQKCPHITHLTSQCLFKSAASFITRARQDPMQPLWLSCALMQTELCCNQTSNEPTGEFLGIMPGCSEEDFESIWNLFRSYFGFPEWTIRDLIPQREKEGVRMMWFEVWKVIAVLSCDNSLPPGSTREVLKGWRHSACPSEHAGLSLPHHTLQ